MSKLEENKLHFIIKEAKRLMLSSSIEEVTMSLLAKDIGLGEATLYRYFGKKENIVIKVAISMWQDIAKKYFEESRITEDLSGIECIRTYLEAFKELYEEDIKFILFIQNFDNYIQKSGMKLKQLNQYDKLFESMKKRFAVYFKKGIDDNTIRNDIDPEIYYYATTHAMQNLIVKLASKPIIEADVKVNHLQQIQMTIDAFILLISKKEQNNEI